MPDSFHPDDSDPGRNALWYPDFITELNCDHGTRVWDFSVLLLSLTGLRPSHTSLLPPRSQRFDLFTPTKCYQQKNITAREVPREGKISSCPKPAMRGDLALTD